MSKKNPKKKYGKKKVEYFCEKCDFLSSNKKDYTRHLKTKKHNRQKKPQKRHLLLISYVIIVKRNINIRAVGHVMF